MKYAHIDKSGRILAWYDDEIHNKQIADPLFYSIIKELEVFEKFLQDNPKLDKQSEQKLFSIQLFGQIRESEIAKDYISLDNFKLDYESKKVNFIGKRIVPDVPTPNIEASVEDWQKALAINANFYDFENKEFLNKDLRSYTDITKDRLLELQSVFMQKIIDIKSIACDKTGTNDYINEQYQTYLDLDRAAKAGLFSEAENIAIIKAHELARQATAPITKGVNDTRSAIQKLIEANHPDVDTFISRYRDIKLSFDVTELQGFVIELENLLPKQGE